MEASRNVVEEEVGRVLTAESLVTPQMVENEEKWCTLTNYHTYIMQRKKENERQ